MTARRESLDVEPEYLTSSEAAARAGIKVKSLYALVSRGHAPEPDLTWLGRSLWLASTIDAWRAERYTRRKAPRLPRRYRRPATGKRPKAPKRRLPPKLASGERMPEEPKRPVPRPVSEALAREAATALRSEGFHCTAADVAELAVSGKPLERERELLQRRVRAKLSALRRAARAAETGGAP